MSVKITTAQAVRLAKVKKAGPKGLAHGQVDETMRILERKGFVALLPGNRTLGARWVVTDAGNRF